MKRFFVILSAVALSLSGMAQDIKIEKGKFCVGESLMFKYNLSNRYDSFLWDFGDNSTDTSVEPTHKYASAGTYIVTLTATKNGGETKTDTKTIIINAIPDIDFSYDTTEQHNVLNFKADLGVTHYKWYFGDDNVKDTTGNETTHKYSAPGTYVVELIAADDNGCADTASHEVKVGSSSKVPNVFTPNGDGKNDYFMISCSEGSRLKLEIFNRWGYKIFSRTGTENIVWDGYNPQGTLVAPGTYFYVITVEEGSTDYNPLNGYITVFY
jgi:gliding motility-associated-like protein